MIQLKKWFAFLTLAVVGLCVMGAIQGNHRADRIRTCQALLDDATGYHALDPRIDAREWVRLYVNELHCPDLAKSGQIKGRIK